MNSKFPPSCDIFTSSEVDLFPTPLVPVSRSSELSSNSTPDRVTFFTFPKAINEQIVDILSSISIPFSSTLHALQSSKYRIASDLDSNKDVKAARR